jgi:hypothetical protein
MERDQFKVTGGQLSLQDVTLVNAPSSDKPALKVAGDKGEDAVVSLKRVVFDNNAKAVDISGRSVVGFE